MGADVWSIVMDIPARWLKLESELRKQHDSHDRRHRIHNGAHFCSLIGGKVPYNHPHPYNFAS